MGILHSTTRFLVHKKRDYDEEEEGGNPNLQNEYISSERSAKLLSFIISIYKALKGLLRKVSSILYLAKPRKAADPLLPVQNPASEPLLVQTPPSISSPTSTTTFDDEELECDDDVLWCEEENYSADVDHHVVVFASASAAVFVEENASRNSPFLDEITIARRLMEFPSSSPSEEEDEEVKIKNVIVVGEERWIKHYSSRHRILLVGEGDFSFSASLAVSFRCASNIVATSLDSQAFLKNNYWNTASTNIEELRSRGSKVMHGINATTMANHQVLGQQRFDRIIFNFPYAGLSVIKNMSRQDQLGHHQKLVRLFLENARDMLSEKGEIHITHKTNGFHAEWRLVSLASGRGLRLIEAVKFNHLDYSGYNTKCGFGGNNCFNCYPSKTYKFGL